MSVDSEKVWLVAVTSTRANSKSVSGHRLHATASGASEGLREAFEEQLGIDDLPPEAITATERFEGIEGYEGSFEINGMQVDYLVIELPVGD